MQNLGRHATGPLGVILARRAPGGAWTALYGSGQFIGGAEGYGIAGVVGFHAGEAHLLPIFGVACDVGWPWVRDAIVELDDRTIRIVEARD